MHLFLCFLSSVALASSAPAPFNARNFFLNSVSDAHVLADDTRSYQIKINMTESRGDDITGEVSVVLDSSFEVQSHWLIHFEDDAYSIGTIQEFTSSSSSSSPPSAAAAAEEDLSDFADISASSSSSSGGSSKGAKKPSPPPSSLICSFAFLSLTPDAAASHGGGCSIVLRGLSELEANPGKGTWTITLGGGGDASPASSSTSSSSSSSAQTAAASAGGRVIVGTRRSPAGSPKTFLQSYGQYLTIGGLIAAQFVFKYYFGSNAARNADAQSRRNVGLREKADQAAAAAAAAAAAGAARQTTKASKANNAGGGGGGGNPPSSSSATSATSAAAEEGPAAMQEGGEEVDPMPALGPVGDDKKGQ